MLAIGTRRSQSPDMTAWQTSTSDRIGTLEKDHRALLVAFGAAFAFIIVMFAAGYLSLSAKMDAGFDRVSAKIDLLAATTGDIKSDVAVLKADSARAKIDSGHMETGENHASR